MPDKPKVAFYWCASCGGCEESVVDLAEDILFVVDNVDIVFWPVGLDFKRADVEKMDEGEILVSFINGAVRSSEQFEMAKLLRNKSKLVIAYGSCAHLGGIPGLANEFNLESIFNFVYYDSPSTDNPAHILPLTKFSENGFEVELPALWETVRPLSKVIDVDYYIPGCPPSSALLKSAVLTLLSGVLPEKGSVLAPDIALCDECKRKDTKPSDLAFKEFKRPHLDYIDPDKCILAQGFICMGPSTRSGCGGLCVDGNMPCTGCYGPTSRVKDQGAKILSSIASNIEAKTDKEILAILEGIPDPVGTFFRYSLAGSLLFKKI